MSRAPDDELLARVDAAGFVSFSGRTWRHTAARRPPMSGAGAREFGGRWNPPSEFATIYLATPVRCCLAELRRLAESQGLEPADLLSTARTLHEIDVRDVRLLDLREPSGLASVGLAELDVRGDDRSRCQAVGHAAWFLELDGVVAPSATSAGTVVALFEQRVGPGHLEIVSSRTLDVELYDSLRERP